jgi:hypothetical protein
MRDFRTMRDVHLGYALLEQLDAAPDLFRGLFGLDIAGAAFRAQIAGYEIRLSQILLTAFARAMIDDRLAVEPLEPNRLEEARRAILSLESRPARLSEAFRRRIDDIMRERLGDDLRRRSADYVNSCLNLLEEDLGDIDPARPIDPRFIRSLLIRREPAH